MGLFNEKDLKMDYLVIELIELRKKTKNALIERANSLGKETSIVIENCLKARMPREITKSYHLVYGINDQDITDLWELYEDLSIVLVSSFSTETILNQLKRIENERRPKKKNK